jgi:hypothetical protein
MSWTLLLATTILCSCSPKQVEKNVLEYPQPIRYDLDMINVDELPESGSDTGEEK